MNLAAFFGYKAGIISNYFNIKVMHEGARPQIYTESVHPWIVSYSAAWSVQFWSLFFYTSSLSCAVCLANGRTRSKQWMDGG